MRVTGRKEAVIVGSLLDRLIDVLALALLVAGGGLLAPGTLGTHAGAAIAVMVLGGGAVILTTLLFVRSRRVTRWLGRARRRIARARVALRVVARRSNLAGVGLSIAVCVQGAFVLLNAFLGAAVGLWVPLQVWFLTWPLAKLAALVPISLGGLGVREVALAGLLQPFGVPAVLAVAQSLIWETILVAGGLSAGLLWWVMSMVRRESQVQRAQAAPLLALEEPKGS